MSMGIPEEKTAERVLEYIRTNWQKTVRFHVQDEGTRFGLPYPYTVPCMKGAYQDLYYWDTYFACRGMALQGMAQQVLNNCRDFLCELSRFGRILNANCRWSLNRSQPPFFGALAELTHRLFPEDRALLAEMAEGLEREFAFWESRRRFPNGLFHYGADPTPEDLVSFYSCGVGRGIYPAQAPSREYREQAVRELMAEAESGMDFTPRFQRRCPDFAAVDLNALLVRSYRVLADFCGELGETAKQRIAREKAETLRALLLQYCWDGTRGMFYDWDSVSGKHAPLCAASALVPLWCGCVTEEEARALQKGMEKYLECPWGIAACGKNDSGKVYQWDYPQGWAPHQFMAMEGLAEYHLDEAARRIAAKYVSTVCRVFEKTGDLWEKYNVVEGSIEVAQESGKLPAMLGWTAGTFVYGCSLLSAPCAQ